MRSYHRVAAVAASLALAGGGLLGLASPAAASASGLSCGNPKPLVGSAGHHGASISCTGGAFTEFIDCFKPGYGTYRHFGNRAVSGGTSTTWCDIGADVTTVGVTAS
ncbi:hypothetical protein [Streptomyces laculatispora]|uniref:hypothetical protein n=1 Tax=Streptomyces laculatispora TaxID=887464 RepID=UPI001A93C489|nr:hypothetical protein [Streptomyces laculatispora]MBO0918541.1 hypothetical protein [Streptomyces laculatispora]